MTNQPKTTYRFIVKCMCCGAIKSVENRPDLMTDKISHGLCEPLCVDAIKAGWGRYLPKNMGGEL